MLFRFWSIAPCQTMTTWKQPEYERVMEELRMAEDKEKRASGRKKETMVTKTMTSDPDFLTEKEMSAVSSVYRSHGTSEEEGTIRPRDLPQAMRSLGLNPSEQEVIDIPNYITRRGLIYLTDFCQMILKWFRDDVSQEEHFKQLMFRVDKNKCSIWLMMIGSHVSRSCVDLTFTARTTKQRNINWKNIFFPRSVENQN